MKADRNDAPEHLSASYHRRSFNARIIPSILGAFVSLGILYLAGSAFQQRTTQKVAESSRVKTSAPIEDALRPVSVAPVDWETVVETQAKRATQIQQSASVGVTEKPKSQPKQNIFNDNNYIPRGADNVVSFAEVPAVPEKPVQTAQKVRVTVVEQPPSMKDRACWPAREGSIERRSCRRSVGLNYRD